MTIIPNSGIHMCMSKKDSKNSKRIVFNVSDGKHQQIKMAATRRGLTITRYVSEAIEARLKAERE